MRPCGVGQSHSRLERLDRFGRGSAISLFHLHPLQTYATEFRNILSPIPRAAHDITVIGAGVLWELTQIALRLALQLHEWTMLGFKSVARQKEATMRIWSLVLALTLYASYLLRDSAFGEPPLDPWNTTTDGHYVGELVYAPLSDGRHMRLVKPFAFVDHRGLPWIVPSGAVTDGASIPSPFWSIVGGPFEGKYRDAAVIHDYYCDVRVRPWQMTDRVFYEAMIVSGVSQREAKILYMAVVYGGPRWDLQTIENNQLAVKGEVTRAASALSINQNRGPSTTPTDAAIAGEGVSERPEPPRYNDRTARKLADVISRENPTLDQIDAMVRVAQDAAQ